MNMCRQWCSPRIIHRTCEYMHWGVRLGGLNMPNGWYTLHMHIILSCGVLRRTVTYIWCKLSLPIFLLSLELLALM